LGLENWSGAEQIVPLFLSDPRVSQEGEETAKDTTDGGAYNGHVKVEK
jgi:hypothetical protein